MLIGASVLFFEKPCLFICGGQISLDNGPLNILLKKIILPMFYRCQNHGLFVIGQKIIIIIIKCFSHPHIIANVKPRTF
jgi:hypothetical protein